MSKNSIVLLGACLAVTAMLQYSPVQAQSKNSAESQKNTIADGRVVAVVKGSKILFRDVRIAH